MSKICIKYIVSGRVQGVWYRATIQKFAHQLDVLGYAKNFLDGTVEVVACADQATLDQFEEYLWHGSKAAKVSHIDQSKLPEQHFENFTIC